jgi:DNA-binding MarR family transcriptional regulator
MVYSSPVESEALDGTSRDQLVGRITDMASAMRRLFEIRPSAEERSAWLSLTAHQLEALAVLEEGSLTMGEFCERLDIAESAGTALSDRLVARGMASRETDDADRRVVRLSLSDEARAMVERFRELKRRRIADALSVLDSEDLGALVRIHEQLLAGAGCVPRPGRPRRAEAGPA